MFFALHFVAFIVTITCAQSSSGYERRSPTVLISILIRNKEHSLPYFFTSLENLDYDKDRLSLWIRSDHNEDNTLEIVETWLQHTRHLYHNVSYEFQVEPKRRNDETSSSDWNESRFNDVIRMKEEALTVARDMWADYIFFLDADVIFTNRNVLKYLVSLNLPIVAPMLKSEAMYSNFWGGMSSNFYYVRTAEYKEIRHETKTGEFAVPMVHSAVLIDTRLVDYDKLTFNKGILNEKLHDIYRGPDDDIITFAVSANYTGISMFITNQETFGYIPVPLEPEDKLEKEYEQLTNILLQIVAETGGVTVSEILQKYVKTPEKDKLGFSKIFMINLERRSERRAMMKNAFDLLGLDVEHLPAVDGKELTNEKLDEYGIEFLNGYVDPYHKRPMTFGEIGCFLSHYLIWEMMVVEKLDTVLILEDDIKFEPYFRESTHAIMSQAATGSQWNLIYFGRKKLQESNEPIVPGTTNLVEVDYSYWTLGYVINREGAEKLLASEPLKRLLPVDEFLPIMFDKHPNAAYKAEFAERNLVAWSATPLLLYPTRYTGEAGYISDTEQSSTIVADDPLAEKKGKKGNFDEINTEMPEMIMSAMPHVTRDKTEL